MQKAHSRINWENLPSINTPLGANNLNKMDKALDVVDDRVLSLYGYEGRVAQSEKNAKESEANAKTSETNAKQSELKAKEYMENAFSGTPDGYDKLVEDVRLMDIKTTTDTTLSNSKAGGYKLLSMSGNSVQNGTPTPTTPYAINNVGDCVEMMQGLYSASNGAFSSGSHWVCNKNPIPCASGNVISLAFENTFEIVYVLYYNNSAFVSAVDIASTGKVTVPSGVTHFNFEVRKQDVTVDTVGKISLTINGKYVVQIKSYDDNGNEKVATVLLNEPLRDGDILYRTHVERHSAEITYDGSTSFVFLTEQNVNYVFASPVANAKPNSLGVCNMMASTEVGLIDNNFFFNGNSQPIFCSNSISSADEWKALISEKPCTIQYSLATPIIETLDTDSQIALNSLETFDTVTYINVDSRTQPSEIVSEYGTGKVGALVIQAYNEGFVKNIEINADLNNKVKVTDSPNAYCEVNFPIAENDYYSLELKPSSLSYSYFDNNGVRHPYWDFEPLKSTVTVDSYARVLNSNGALIGSSLKTHQSAKPIYVIDPQNPSYYWYGIFYHNGKTFVLNEISSNGLTVAANAYGTISPSGGSGSYTFINLIPSNVLE